MRATRALPALYLLWRAALLLVLLSVCAGSAPAPGGGAPPDGPAAASNASAGPAGTAQTGQACPTGTVGPACASGACAAAAAAAARSPPGEPDVADLPTGNSAAKPGAAADVSTGDRPAGTAAAGQPSSAAATQAAAEAVEPAAADAVPAEQAAAPVAGDTEVEGSIVGPPPPAEPLLQPAAAPEAAQEPELEQQHNFALAKEGAKVLAANKEAKKAGALLDDDSDTFLKNECRAVDKWVIIELSQVARISRLELGQFELYSARVKEFSAHGRQSHPRTDGFGTDYAKTLNSSQWKLLGSFTAEKVKGSQVFTVPRPRWVRYLLLRFLNQHGPETVCAVNGVSVFGKSAVEELEDQLASELREEEEGLGLLPPPAELTGVAAAAGAAPAGPPAEVAAAVTLGEDSMAADVDSGAVPGQPTPVAQEQPTGEAAAGGDSPDEDEEGGGNGTCAVQQEQPGSVRSSWAEEEGQPTTLPASGAVVDGTNGTEASAAGTTAGVGGSQPPQPAAATVPPVTTEPATAPGDSATGAATGQPAVNGSTAASAAASGRQAAQQAAQLPATQQQAHQQQQPPQAKAVPSPQPQQATGNTSNQPGTAVVPDAATGTLGVATAGQPQQQAQQPSAGTAVPMASPDGQPGSATTTARQPANGKPVSNGGTAAVQAGQPDGQPSQEPLDLPLAIAAKGKGGGSVYDILVQEIKAAKLQQKLLVKSVAELQRNSSGAYAELAGDLASLAARLAKLPAEPSLSEEALAARVDTLVKAHLLQVTSHLLALQTALASSAKQQHALLCFLAMLGGVLTLNGTRFAEQWPRAKWAVLLLAAANGLVGVALQLQGGMARQPHWMQALPWDGNAPGVTAT